jgi:AraC-like DNA-binding protein
MFVFGLNDFVAAVTLVQLLVFLIFLLASQYRLSTANQILATLFFLLITAKLDQVYQMQGGLESHPQFAFVLVPLQLLIAPALYLFVRAKVDADFRFQPRYLYHLIPAGLLYLYYGSFLFGRDVTEIRALIQSGMLTGAIDNVIIPATADLVQIVYLIAALKLLRQQGGAFKNWFSGNEDETIRSLQWIFVLWALVFLTHFTVIIFSALTDMHLVRMLAFETMNILHLLLINALMLAAIVSHLKWPTAYNTSVASLKYAASSLSADARKALFDAAQKSMLEHRHYLNPDLTLGQLAHHIAATPRELSEAINSVGEQSFFEYVNRYRIEAAAQKLKSNDSETVLQIALAVGFNSKSSFNNFFKKQMGLTPSQYRKTAL